MKKILVFAFIVTVFAACQSGNKSTGEAAQEEVQVQLVETTIDIGGMDCDMCVKSVEKGVSELAGISSVEVSLEDSTAFVKYDKVQVQLAEIEKAIEKRGYSIKPTM
ncbi:MAG: heavy-metal-associated domain-containing protein [Prolixibacteraceae bacterium]|nr:heavy-metal-associated domain-containing protein [Prolixibacteraceae bacterium]